MAKSLFPNYDKFGSGVDKNEVRSNGPARYFAVYFRKFWSLAFVNLIYLLIFLPVTALCLFLVNLVFNAGLGNSVSYILCFAPIILLAPANAGMTKVTRDFVREEPGFVWSDFWESAKKNLKQSFAVSVIGYLGAALFVLAGLFYYSAIDPNNFLSMIPFALCVSLAFVFIFILMYAQLMVVTLDLKLKPLMKNAAILSIVALGKNFLAVILCAVFLALYGFVFYLGLGSYGALILTVVLTFMIIFALISYTMNYITFPVIQKYIIDPYYKANPNETADAVLKAMDPDRDEETQEEIELPEYVYENGRMVHRSVIENEQLFKDRGNEDKKDQNR